MNQGRNSLHVQELLARAERLGTGELRWSEAADLLKEASESSSVVLQPLSFYLSRAKRYEEARSVLGQLLQADQGSFRSCYMMGYQHYAEEHYDEAVPWFERALAIDSGHVGCWWRLAHARDRLGQHVKAQIAAGQVLRIWPQLADDERQRTERFFARASYLLGRLQMPRDLTGAIALLEQAVKHDAGDHDKHYRLGKAYRIAGRQKDAVVALRRADRIKPGQAYIEIELACASATLGERDVAERLLERVDGRCRDWMAVKAGRLALQLEKPRMAVRLLERAVRDRQVAKDESVLTDLERARRLVPAVQAGTDCQTIESMYGRVDVVNDAKGFGFLVEDETGTRRHFRIPAGTSLKRGDRVRFQAVAAEKGPAARELNLVVGQNKAGKRRRIVHHQSRRAGEAGASSGTAHGSRTGPR